MLTPDRDQIPCREGGALHRHVRGSRRCADCDALVVVGERFVRAVAVGE